MTDTAILAKASHSYRINQKQWDFLGYSEPVALAVLAEFFSMERPRNPSQKPLNVLAMVGKSRIRAIKEEVEAAMEQADGRKDDGEGVKDEPGLHFPSDV